MTSTRSPALVRRHSWRAAVAGEYAADEDFPRACTATLDALGRTGHDDVAILEAHEFEDAGENRVGFVNHQFVVALLAQLAVDFRASGR